MELPPIRGGAAAQCEASEDEHLQDVKGWKGRDDLPPQVGFTVSVLFTRR